MVADVGRGLHLGGGNALPAADEGLGVDGVTVVELHALLELEGVDQTILGDGRGFSGTHGHSGVGVPVPGHEAIEHGARDSGALILLSVVRVDVGGLGEIEAHHVVAGGSRGGAAALSAATAAATGESSKGTRGEGAAHKRTTTHHGLGKFGISHAILLIMQVHGTRSRICTPLVRPEVRTRIASRLLFARPLG